MMLSALIVFKFYNPESNLAYARTMAFTVLMTLQMFNVFNSRADRTSAFKIGIFSNKYLIMAVASSLLLQVVVIYTSLNRFFKTVPISIFDWVVVILVSSTVLVAGEIVKYINNRIEKQKATAWMPANI